MMTTTTSRRMGLWTTITAIGLTLLCGRPATANTIAQGDQDTRAHLVRSTFGVDGSGLKIGIISDSFNVSGAGGAVPPVNVLQEGFAPGNVWNLPVGTDQGRAMAEVVNHVAPGAQLMFHAASNSPDANDFTAGPGGAFPASSDPGDSHQPKPSGLVTAIEALVAAGADVIINDSGYFNEPWFQHGEVANAVTAAFNGTLPGSGGKRVPVVTSAGHFGNQSWEGPLIQSNFSAGFPVGSRAGTFHLFDNGLSQENLFLDLNIPAGESITVAMQWSEPFPINGSTSYDLDLFLERESDGQDLAMSERMQVNPGGGNADDDRDGEPDYNPWELLSYTNAVGSDLAARLLVKIAIDGNAITDPTVKIIVAGADVDMHLDPNATNSPTVVGHAAAPGALAIGTLDHGLYTFGVSGVGTPVDDNSSVGQHVVLYDEFGNPIASVPAGPDLVGPDGVVTSFFNFDPGSAFDGARYYDGASSAAAYVGAIAALLMQKANDMGSPLTPEQLYAFLTNNAVNLADPDWPDDSSGYGMVNVFGAFEDLTGIPEPGAAGMLAMLAGGCLLRRSRAA